MCTGEDGCRAYRADPCEGEADEGPILNRFPDETFAVAEVPLDCRRSRFSVPEEGDGGADRQQTLRCRGLCGANADIAGNPATALQVATRIRRIERSHGGF